MNIDVSTQGIQDLIMAVLQWLSNFKIQDVNSEFMAPLLDLVAPIWNPIWALVNKWLGEYFHF